LDNLWLIRNSLVSQLPSFEKGPASLPNFIAGFVNAL
jgi:hypothetical protein